MEINWSIKLSIHRLWIMLRKVYRCQRLWGLLPSTVCHFAFPCLHFECLLRKSWRFDGNFRAFKQMKSDPLSKLIIGSESFVCASLSLSLSLSQFCFCLSSLLCNTKWNKKRRKEEEEEDVDISHWIPL